MSVGAGDQLLKGYIRTPETGLCELAWNSFDSDAGDVAISFTLNDAGVLDTVIVEDNGDGMGLLQVQAEFARVGESWKAKTHRRSHRGRPVHGRHGRGRYSAFSIGDRVEWQSTTRIGDSDKLATVIVRFDRGDLKQVEYEECRIPLRDTPGTLVRIRNITDAGQKAFDKLESIRARLTTEFALHLKRFTDFSIAVGGIPIDPSKVIESESDLDLELPRGIEGAATLKVIEWQLPKVERRIYKCDSDGAVVGEEYARVRAVGLQFSAYLTWAGFGEQELIMETEGSEDDPAEDDVDAPASERVVTAARKRLRAHLHEMNRRREVRTVQQWKSEGIYPYSDDVPEDDPMGAAKREAFQMVAFAASRSVDDSKSPKTKKLALALLKETFESDPERLFPILREVVGLPTERIEELEGLMSRTSISHLIQSAHQVGTRLDFVNGLEDILFDRQTKRRLEERRQLHRILVGETWIFGEEWAVTGDDERLGKVLTKFLKFLGDADGMPAEIAIPKTKEAEPLREDGRVAIPDLVLGRSLETAENKNSFLVVELKRPSKILDDSDVSQLRSYAEAITADERFTPNDVQWRFVLVGNDANNAVNSQRRQRHLPFGVIQTDPYVLEVRQWSELIADARHRMKFIQKSLQYESSHSAGLDYLRQAYAQYLPPETISDGEELEAS
ncbi:ATP-binding protein [Mycolicibacterium farcinogenes]|uniref:ATP-binding protein n=1 Tax=Mycolicibacterium farcinogenes TaxID=1802 RepID=UPI001C8E612B|nr:ATP-binding protein [Mycolicibacterium farcinogenes]QZH61270.1 ATP-binding protein [Mycolicibacterium farcinogenes]